jgi:hypothetical protein
MTVVYRSTDHDDVLAREMELISLFGRDKLTNLTDGGDGVIGRRLSSETRAKISAAHMKRVSLTCQHCGAGFTRTPSQIALGGGFFCSLECRFAAKRGSNSANWRGGPNARLCAACGTPFTCHQLSRQRFCSVACRGIGRRSGIEKCCVVCGKLFWTKPSKSHIQCCSTKCGGDMRRGRPKRRHSLSQLHVVQDRLPFADLPLMG